MVLKERCGAEESVFIGTLRSCDDLGEGRKVAELGLETCNKWEPRRVVKDSI